MEKPKTYGLFDRPKWWGVKVLRFVAIALLVCSAVFFLVSAGTGFLHNVALGSVDDGETVYLNVSYMTDELAWAALSVGFYATVLWFLSEIMDKVDQLVWLAATDEDRAKIIKKRKKKNAKNN